MVIPGRVLTAKPHNPPATLVNDVLGLPFTFFIGETVFNDKSKKSGTVYGKTPELAMHTASFFFYPRWQQFLGN
jgi:hypothetical protein